MAWKDGCDSSGEWLLQGRVLAGRVDAAMIEAEGIEREAARKQRRSEQDDAIYNLALRRFNRVKVGLGVMRAAPSRSTSSPSSHRSASSPSQSELEAEWNRRNARSHKMVW